MNQRPRSGITHCGLGLSCQSPTQPSGRIAKLIALTSPGKGRIHCGGRTAANALLAKAGHPRQVDPAAAICRGPHMQKGISGGRSASVPSLSSVTWVGRSVILIFSSITNGQGYNAMTQRRVGTEVSWTSERRGLREPVKRCGDLARSSHGMESAGKV